MKEQVDMSRGALPTNGQQKKREAERAGMGREHILHLAAGVLVAMEEVGDALNGFQEQQ